MVTTPGQGPRPTDADRAADVRLLVVDDHEIVRQGIVTILDHRPGFAVVGEAGTVVDAVAEARRVRPDLIVMDVRLPDGSGVEACREILAESPATRVVMFTGTLDEDGVLAAVLAGASGYLLKRIRARDLVTALEAVARGESLLDPGVTERVRAHIRRLAAEGEGEGFGDLTVQERRILALMAEGRTNRAIASAMFLSEKTVKNYVSAILSKLNLERRTQAAAFVAQHHRQDSPD
ncbi:MAG: response regulator [Candidatus Limnocylindrales bacterium]